MDIGVGDLVRFVQRSYEPGVDTEILPGVGLIVDWRPASNVGFGFPAIYEVHWTSPLDGEELPHLCFKDQLTKEG
jgi:hypothetical protein